MGIELLGPLRVDGDGSSLRPRDRVLLSALAVRPGEVVAPDRLADALWGEQPPASWPKQVQICVMRLRKELGPPMIETTGGGYRLTVGFDDVDVARFEDLVERGRVLAASGEPERAASTLTRALGLWRGEAFQDLDRWPPGRNEAARLAELRRTAEEELLDARLAAGEHRDVAAEAEARVAEEPLRERRWAILALAQYRCGRQAEALRTLNRARHTLTEQLGIDPGAELVALEAAILRQDPSLVAAPAPSVLSAECPYKGLAAYDAGDAEWFFGRDAEVAACLERLQTHDLLVVAGPSGCGKSSLVRAGLVPALERRGHGVAVVVPGSDPDAALASVLAGAPGHPVVVVDQAEELFTLQANTDTAHRFCARLAADAAERAPVVVVVRADHLAGLAADPEFARLVEQGLYLLGPLTGDRLRAAIEGPATQAGLLLEPGLVDLLVRDTEGEPGALPLLSHALAETWRRRDGRVLTVEGYRATGGIRGAVARSADRLYDSLPASQRTVLRSVMLRLVAPAEDGEPVRSRVATRNLRGDQARERVVGLLVRARLVTAEEDTVELAHEALARAWPRLRSWLDEDAAGQRILRHLAAAADGWESLGRPDSELYRGARLDGTLEWRTATGPDLTATEAAFLDASVARRSAEQADLAAQAEAQRRSNRRLRSALGGVATLLVLALISGAVAFTAQRRATENERAAALRALVSSSVALRANKREMAALLAVEAHRLAPSAATESALFATFTGTGSLGLERTVRPDDPRLTESGAVFVDAETIAVDVERGTVDLVDVVTGERRGRLEVVPDDPNWDFGWLSASPDGRHLATAIRGIGEPVSDDESSLTVWDLATQQKRFANVTLPYVAGTVALSPDSALVAVGGEDRIQIYDAPTGALRTEVDFIPRPADAHYVVNTVALAFTPDGRLIVGSQAGPIRVLDPTTGRELQRIEGPRETSELNLLVSPDGRSLVTAGFNGLMRYALPSGQAQWQQPAATEECINPGYAGLIGVVLCSDQSGRVIAIDLATGAILGERFNAQHGDVCGLAVSADQTTLVETSCAAPEYHVWRLDGGGAASRLAVATTDEHHVLWYGPDNDTVVTEFPAAPGELPTTQFVDPGTGEIVDQLPGAYAPVATEDPNVVIALFDEDGTVGRYDLARHRRIGTGVDPGFEPNGLAPIGDLVAVWGYREPGTDQQAGSLRAIDPTTGALTGPTVDLDELNLIFDVAAPDATHLVTSEYPVDEAVLQRRDPETGDPIGERVDTYQNGNIAAAAGQLVVVTGDGQVLELDADTLEPVGAPFPGLNGSATEVALSDDGRRLLVLGFDRTLHLYDVETRTQLGDAIPVGVEFGGAALRGDGLEAAVATDQGIAVWDLDPDHWVEGACQIAGRNLTRAEWDQYIGDLATYRRTCSAFPEG